MSLFKPVGAKKTYIQIIEQFQELIRKGLLKPGERLPSERELAQQFETSRASVREALSAMEIMGIIQTKKGSGSYISLSPENILANHFAELEKLSREITPHEILYAREVIEVGAAELAAVNAGEAALQRMLSSIENMEKRLQDMKKRIKESEEDILQLEAEDKLFHSIIFEACENRILQKAAEYLQESMNKEFWLVLKRKTLTLRHAERYLQEHKKIFEAICSRDPKKAGSEMRKHLVGVRKDRLGVASQQK